MSSVPLAERAIYCSLEDRARSLYFIMTFYFFIKIIIQQVFYGTVKCDLMSEFPQMIHLIFICLYVYL